MKTQAMVLKAFNQPLYMEDIEIPALEEGQVLVRIAAAGVCGSDVHIWRGEDKRARLPLILGHEGVGYIEDIKGQKYSITGRELNPGDLIIWNRGINCGRCYACQVLKQPSLCQNRYTYGISISCSQPPYLTGCYARHIILDKDTDIIELNPDIDPITMVSASCSGATVAHAFDMSRIKPGDTVVVQGPGPLGMYAVAFARASGAKQIIVIGGSDNRLTICKNLGATMVLDRKSTTVQQRRAAIMEATGGRGAEVVVEAAGYPDAVPEGLDLLAVGGTYLSIGFAQFTGYSTVDFFSQVVYKNARIQGVWVSDTSHLYDAVNLVSQRQEAFKDMITHVLPLESANTALELMASKQALKAVLVP